MNHNFLKSAYLPRVVVLHFLSSNFGHRNKDYILVGYTTFLCLWRATMFEGLWLASSRPLHYKISDCSNNAIELTTLHGQKMNCIIKDFGWFRQEAIAQLAGKWLVDVIILYLPICMRRKLHIIQWVLFIRLHTTSPCVFCGHKHFEFFGLCIDFGTCPIAHAVSKCKDVIYWELSPRFWWVPNLSWPSSIRSPSPICYGGARVWDFLNRLVIRIRH